MFSFEFSQYGKHGKTLNTLYLSEIANRLRKHSSVFKGDFELLAANALILAADKKKDKSRTNWQRHLHTWISAILRWWLRYVCRIWTYRGHNKIFKKRTDIKVYRVLDCYMNEISLPLK